MQISFFYEIDIYLSKELFLQYSVNVFVKMISYTKHSTPHEKVCACVNLTSNGDGNVNGKHGVEPIFLSLLF